jgi:hypothetical protein
MTRKMIPDLTWRPRAAWTSWSRSPQTDGWFDTLSHLIGVDKRRKAQTLNLRT